MKPLSLRLTKEWRVRTQKMLWAALAALATSACAAPSAPAAGDAVELREPEPQNEVIELRQGELPNVTLTADVLYRLLVSDFALHRGAIKPAADTSLELARYTTDPRLAQRALELYMLMNQYQGALHAVNVWLDSEPNNEEAQSMRLALMAALDQTEGLDDALVEYVKKQPDKTQALAQVMGILGRMEDRQKALDLIEQVIDRSGQKKTMVAEMALADMAQAAGHDQEASEHARKALARDPNSEDAAMRVLDYGFVVDPTDAIKRAQTFIKKHPDSRRLRMMLVGRLAEADNIDGAIAELKAMSAQFPEDFDLLFVRAQFAFQVNRLDEANQLLNEFVEVQKQRKTSVAEGASDASAALDDAYTLMAAIAQRQGEPDRAIELLGRIENPEALFETRLRQAKIRADSGKVDEAVRMIDALHPADSDEHLIGVLTLTQILRQADRSDEAIERLIEADQLLRDSIEVKYELGMMYAAQDDLDNMERYLREVIDLDPDYAHALNALGYVLADRNLRLDEAYSLISRAHQLLPQDPFIMDSLGWVKYRQGDLVQARAFLEQAYAIQPQAEISAHLGEVLWEMDKQNQAREIWEAGLVLEPENDVLQETMQRYLNGQ
ncbi:tetratricopeptide repeat protein [Orrella sp. 11846]|uniref:tetratricopeptide repeat protein n=1 Tax=Orrella sp. 11846 TaxID=3409913 RepID=UPI003B5C7A58